MFRKTFRTLRTAWRSSLVRRILAIVGFVALGLSPSFLEWEESPKKRPQIFGYYAVAVILIYFGLFGSKKGEF